MSTPPAGWYVDPSDPSQERYWGGREWTNEVRPKVTAPAPAPAPTAAPQPPPPLALAAPTPQPPIRGRRPWWKKKRFLLPGAVVAGFFALLFLAVIVAAIAGTSPSDDEVAEEATTTTEGESTTAETPPPTRREEQPAPAETEFPLPPIVEDGGDFDDFWMTSYTLVIPEGYWEPNSVDPQYCVLIDEPSFVVETSEGVLIDDAVTPDRTSSIVGDDGSCTVRDAVVAKLDQLGSGYVVTNGVIEARLTPDEFFAGQGEGDDAVVTFVELNPGE